MKSGNMSDATKLLIFAATVIIVCFICGMGFKVANEGKAAVNDGTGQFSSMTSEYQDIEKTLYDGSNVSGNEVVNFITGVQEKGAEEYLSIWVKTLANKTTGVYYNYKYTDSTTAMTTSTTALKTAKGDADYINRNAQFLGKVHKDANNNIICIEFVQLK
ncbi:MAG: hypothetical protein K0S47_4090 [Herbinix sp.]|jgi:hypothetical protein|nr:hypothetical protein [Herbinix sp.]